MTTWTLSTEDVGAAVITAAGSAVDRPAAAADLVAATRQAIERLARTAGRAPTLTLQLDEQAAAVIKLSTRAGLLDLDQAYDYVDRIADALAGDTAPEED